MIRNGTTLAACAIVVALAPACTDAPSSGNPASSTTDEPVTAVTSDRASATPSEARVLSVLDGTATVALDDVPVGPHPQLSWEAVDEAITYEATVFAPDGVGYWAWTGGATTIPVGGEPQLPDDAPGPAVAPGMQWRVLALADDGTVIASSGMVDLDP